MKGILLFILFCAWFICFCFFSGSSLFATTLGNFQNQPSLSIKIWMRKKMRYMINPPSFNTNLPPFILKWYMKNIAKKFVEWSFAEYHHALKYYKERGDTRSVNFITKHCSEKTVLASHPHFKELCKFLNDDTIWNSLSRWERKTIVAAYESMG